MPLRPHPTTRPVSGSGRLLLVAGCIVQLVVAACAAPVAPWGDGSGANVVLIVVDSLRRDHLGCYGYERPTSPNIDRLAAGGILFERAYSQAPWTTPSVAALLASQYPTVLGIRSEPDRLPERFELLPEVLQANGYETAAVVSHYFLSAKWQFDQGVERFDESAVAGHGGISSPRVTELGLAFLAAPRDRPFFLFLHYFDPHYDYLEHDGFRFFDRPYDGWIAPGLPYQTLEARLAELGAIDRERLVSLYDSEIAFTDHHIGRLLDGLTGLGLADRTLVVLTADHGEEFLDHGGVGHGGKLTDELIRVPLIVRPPHSATAGQRDERLVALVDLAPTLLGWLGLRPPPMVGQSLLTAPPASRAVFSETEWSYERAIVSGTLKLIRNPATGRRQLYDLARDPAERRNLFLAGPQAVPRRLAGPLAIQLRDWIAATEAQAESVESQPLSEDEVIALRALGYLGGDRGPPR